LVIKQLEPEKSLDVGYANLVKYFEELLYLPPQAVSVWFIWRSRDEGQRL
jgi:hypothetical protein